MLAGIANASISMDGMSRSFTTTQSASNAYYGTRIKSYLEQLEVLLPRIRAQYAPLPIGTI